VSHVCLNDDVVEGLRVRDEHPRLLGAVPPGGRGRPARRRLPVRPLRRPDDNSRTTPRKVPECPSARHQSVLVIGSGPIVIGQACEFDYSGTQACRVLREEGMRVILVNSNPATIMTDPEFADATYIEPITPEIVEKIIAKERRTPCCHPGRPDRAERRDGAARGRRPREVQRASSSAPTSRPSSAARTARSSRRSSSEAAPSRRAPTSPHHGGGARRGRRARLPLVVRPSFTMGGLGSGFAYDETSCTASPVRACSIRPTTEVLLEESILRAGRSTSSRSCATRRQRRRRLLHRERRPGWACTPATRSPSPRR
jgi:hypothetical protein